MSFFRLQTAAAVTIGIFFAGAAPAAAFPVRPVAVVTTSGPPATTSVRPVRGNRYLVTPCFDPRGRLLTISEEATGSRLERRSTLTGPVMRLRRLRGFDGAFGPNCDQIVELRGRRPSGTEVWLRRGAREPKRILRTAASFERRPAVAWSADARRIAILDRDADRLVVVSTDTGAVVRVLVLARFSNASLSPQAVSPNGALVAFSQGLNDSSVFVLDVRSGAVTKVLEGYGDAAFRPDGARLAAARGALLATVNPDGTELATQGSGVTGIGDPVWSPDGTAIAVTFLPTPTTSGEGIGIVRPGLEGLDRRYYKANFVLLAARWAPDATRLVVPGFSLTD